VAIIGNRQFVDTAPAHCYRDMTRTGIKGVFNEFAQGAGGAFNDFPSGNLIYQPIRELPDYGHYTLTI
jgi:hypothetical protein